MSREVFKGLRIAVCGDFGPNWDTKKIGRFIASNGGKPSTLKAPGVTHLITTPKVTEQDAGLVSFAEQNDIALVTFDWFEDSLQARRKRSESRYNVLKAAKVRRLEKQKRDRLRKANVRNSVNDFALSVQEAKRTYMVSGYEIYRDPTGFKYDITLVRLNILDNKNERIVLKLHTTHEEPHYFACMSTYLLSNHSSRTIEAPVGSSFETAFEAFCRAFKEKTFKDWEDRTDTRPALLADGSRNARAYVYKAPRDGPIGMRAPLCVDSDGYLAGIDCSRGAGPPERIVEYTNTNEGGSGDHEMEGVVSPSLQLQGQAHRPVGNEREMSDKRAVTGLADRNDGDVYDGSGEADNYDGNDSYGDDGEGEERSEYNDHGLNVRSNYNDSYTAPANVYQRAQGIVEGNWNSLPPEAVEAEQAADLRFQAHQQAQQHAEHRRQLEASQWRQTELEHRLGQLYYQQQ